MKISILSFYSGEINRGVETFVHELANRLVNLDVDVTVYQNGPETKNSRYKTVSLNLKIDWKNENWNLLIKKFTQKVLGEIDKDTDILFPTNGKWQSLLCSIWAKIHLKKIIISGQSGIGADDKWNLLCFPDVFIALTDYQKQWAHKFNPFVKIVKIPNGVDLDIFNPKNIPIKINLTHPIILSVGALEKGKRLDLTIKAVAKIPNASLLLVGKGEQESELKELGEKLLPGRYKITSFAHSEMSKVYKSADLFTYPTVPYESFGIAILEAMAVGLPVIATDDPIRREIVGNAGFFINPSDTKGYTINLEKALKKKWGSKPRQQAEKFSWNEISKKYKELFNGR